MRAQREAAMLDPSVVKHYDLRRWVNDFADSHRRWGCRRVYVAALEAGYDIGRDAFRRLWREEQLLVTPRTLRKRGCATKPIARVSPAEHPGHVWALGFQIENKRTSRRAKQEKYFRHSRPIRERSPNSQLETIYQPNDRGLPWLLQ